MSQQERAAQPRLTGHKVIDGHGTSIGKATDVVFDPASGEPRWLIVDPGLMRKEHTVPLHAVRICDDGRIQVPYEKRTVTSSPPIGRDHVLTSEQDEEISRYYEVAGRT